MNNKEFIVQNGPKIIAQALDKLSNVGVEITAGGGGGGAGTQYTEGDTDASITGTVAMMEGAGNALVPAQGTVADGLLVNLGANNDVDTELTTADLDTGAGTDTRAVVGMVLAESGGGALVGSANPMPVRVKLQGATITETSVDDAAVDTTLLASNASRVEVHILNDSTVTLRVSLSATASATSPYIVRAGESLTILPNPDGKMYLGEISGIWDSDAGGAARIVEFT